MISGKSQSGKDVVANTIAQTLQERDYSVLTIHFADLVKFYATQYWNWDGEKNHDGRALLQLIGTTIMRSRYPSYWAKIVAKFIDAVDELHHFHVVLIPDWRFINEYETVYDYAEKLNQKVITIRINRYNPDGSSYINPQMDEQQTTHISECELDNFTFDWIIENRGTLEDLTDSINYFLDSETELW